MRMAFGPNGMPLTALPVTNTCGTNSASEDLFDGYEAARLTESDVDDHQIRAPMRSGGHRFGDIGLHGADGVAETVNRLREQFTDNSVVFHDQSAQRLHRIASPLQEL